MKGAAGASRPAGPGRRARGWALLAGVAVVLAYLAGASLSGGRGPLARRPLLDGLAPPPPYHWVKPPPELAAQNRPPAAAEARVRLGASGSEVTAISTGDGQASLVLEANAIPTSKGATEVAVSINPVDPATLAPAPQGLVLAGNAYRIRLTYRPSGAPARLTGRATVVLVYPLLSIPVGSLFDYTLLASPDGKAWTRQESNATPGSHQVGAVLPQPGYVVVAVPPAPAAAAKPNRIPLIAGLAGAGAVIAIGAVVLARRLRRSADYDYDEDFEDDEDGDEADEADRPGPGHGSEERR
jgi:hypothetical protein